MTSKREIEIGYLCGSGPHYVFYSDPDGDACRTKRMGALVLRIEQPGWGGLSVEECVASAEVSLARVLDTWRHCECPERA